MKNTTVPVEPRNRRMKSSAAVFSLLLSLLTIALQSASASSKPMSEILKDLLINYDKMTRPNEFSRQPENIGITFYFKYIFSFSEYDMDMTVDFYVRQYWTDHRLAFRDRNASSWAMKLNEEESGSIWHPDTFFQNEKSAYLHAVTVPNIYTRIDQDGNILKSSRYTLTVSCPMDLSFFPLDIQICSILVESYGYDGYELQYYWLNDTKRQTLNLSNMNDKLPNYRITNYQLRIGDKQNFSTLALDIQFERSLGIYLIQTYIPSAMLVTVSWFALCLGEGYMGERVSLGVTTILTTTMLLAGSATSSPKFSYIKAMDLYLGVCFGFNFVAILASITAAVLSEKSGSTRSCKRCSSTALEISNEKFTLTKAKIRALELDAHMVAKGRVASRVNTFFRISIPICFIAFNIGYWFYFLTRKQRTLPLDDDSQ